MALTSIASVAVLGACGGNVSVTTGSGGDGGNGNGGAGGAGAGVTGSPVGGGGSTSTSTNVGGGSSDCDGLDHVSCLGAFPSCVPVYDDTCCSSCDPMGGCADCVNLQYHHCAAFGGACGDGPAPCGSAPSWACAGEEAPCANVDPGGSLSPCASVAGCVPAYCATDADCTTDPVCHPATAGSCTAQCDAIPPPCPDGTYPESDGFCYTGFCVPQDLCVISLGGP